MLKDLRLYPRVPLKGEATIMLAGETLPITLINLSQSGLQGECNRSVFRSLFENRKEDGSWPYVELRFTRVRDTPEIEGLRVSCRMVYQRRLSRDAYYIGLAFTDDREEEARGRISRIVSERLVQSR